MTIPTLASLLSEVLDRDASSLHLVVGESPALRVGGAIQRLSAAPMTEPAIDEMLGGSMSSDQRSRLLRLGYIQTSLRHADRRFLCHLFRERGQTGATIVAVSADVPMLEDAVTDSEDLTRLTALAQFRRGLILVTGPAGSGKTTLCAALLESINRKLQKRIVTVEEPIEFDIASKQSLVTQHMVGHDVDSFRSGVELARGADADVVFLAEMRDYDTFESALELAAGGRLVIATSDQPSVTQCLRGYFDTFPSKRDRVRDLLGNGLQAIVAPTLIPKVCGKERACAFEIMIATIKIRGLIQEGRWEVTPFIKEGRKLGMQPLDDSILRLYKAGIISYDEAVPRVSAKEILGQPPG